MNPESYKDAKNKLLSGDYSVGDFFKQNNFSIEYGYCKLLSGDIESAKISFSNVADFDFRADWAKRLIQFIERYVLNMPSYFQVRNFLEIDLNLLLNAGQAEFVENIINGADLFFSINPESYKFIARVMLNNDFIDVALYYLNKAKSNFYYDPEMHFMFANCYLKSGNNVMAEESINNCLGILPEYFPAKRLRASLNV